VRASFARWKRSASTRARAVARSSTARTASTASGAGDFRIVYAVRDDVLVVLVVKIGNRRDVYR
jgi:hypothetical protein